MNILGGILVFFVPETLGRGLPISAAEIESYPLDLTKEEKIDLKEQRKNSKTKLSTMGKENPAYDGPNANGICANGSSTYENMDITHL